MPSLNRKKKLLVFLSHANEDKPMIRELCKRLKEDGFDPWLDEERIFPGQNWQIEVEQALRRSDVILLSFSEESLVKEGYIQREYKKALDYQLEKPKGTIFVIPVRLDNCEIPFFLRDLQYVSYPSGYERLLVSLNIRAGRSALTKKTQAKKSKEDTEQIQRGMGGNKNISTSIVYEDSTYNVEGLPNPYLGLQAFTYNDRDKYAGREQLAKEVFEQLINSTDRSGFIFITGASGSGKSSFAQAGLLPLLITYYEAQGLSVYHDTFRPSKNPKSKLENILNQAHHCDVLVIIVDQFEELLVQSVPDERDYLISYISSLPSDHRLVLIATLRSDYLGEIFEIADLWEKAKHSVSLRSMKLQELRNAIQRPLQSRYLDKGKRFEGKLIDKLAEDAFENATYLPLLQVTLEDLWNKGQLRLSSYNSLTDAIEERANTVLQYRDFDSSSPSVKRPLDEKEKITEVLLKLIHVSIDEDTKKDARINRRMDSFDEDEKSLVKELIRARLVAIDVEDDREIVSLIHEALIRSWSFLSDSIKTKRMQLQKRSRFEVQFKLWNSMGRHEKFLLSEGQLADALELVHENDISMQEPGTQEFVRASSRRLELERTRNKIASVLAILQNPSLSLEINEIIEIILQSVAEIINSEGANLFLVQGEDDHFDCVGTWGLTKFPAETYHHFVKQSMQAFEPQVFHDSSVIVIPIRFRDQGFGTIQLDANSPQQIVTNEELELAMLFVREISRVFIPRWLESALLKMLDAALSLFSDIEKKIQLALEFLSVSAEADAGLFCIYRDKRFVVEAMYGYGETAKQQLLEILVDEDIRSMILGPDVSKQYCWVDVVSKNSVISGARRSLVIPIKQNEELIGLFFFETIKTLDDPKFILRRITEGFAKRIQPYVLVYESFQRIEDRRKAAEVFGKMAFSATTSVHAMRNNVSVIKGTLQILKLKTTDKENEGMIMQALDRVDKMVLLIDNLHQPAKVQNEIGVDVSSVIRRAAERTVGMDIPWIKFSLTPNLLVETIPEMLMEAFKILIKNADDAMSDKSFSEELKLLEIESRLSGGWVIVTIKDHGVGIAPENLLKIFDMKYTTKQSGLGFGLYWTKDYIEGLGGTISAESELGKGTKFTIHLPVIKVQV